MEDHEPSRWRQFCMQYAKSVAFQFAESWQQFLLNDNSKSDTNVPKEDIVEQFTQTFSEELTKRLLSDNPIRHAPDSSLTDRVLNNYQSATMCCGRSRSFWSSPSEGDQKKGATTLDYKKRSQSDFAFVGRTPALTDESGEPQSSKGPASSKRRSWFRSPFSPKTAVELVKESNARYMSGLDLETRLWRKCRLCLLKTAGGYLLEFHSPPKCNRAKSGIFCYLITEARGTFPVEFEDSTESTFVIRGCNGVEYVIEAKNREDCKQWLKLIRDCIPETNLDLAERSTRHSSPSPSNCGRLRASHLFSSRSLNNVNALTATPFNPSRYQVSLTCVRGFENYPWFHDRLSRELSARLVLHSGVDGHGLFLVRKSETRPGEFVLTFNCEGKAKHARITVLPDGDCRIHQMLFESMIDLLEHFRENPIPLEESALPPMLLTEYVICWSRFSSRTAETDARDFLTYGGSVRIDIRTLEQIVQRQQEANRQRIKTRAHANTMNLF